MSDEPTTEAAVTPAATVHEYTPSSIVVPEHLNRSDTDAEDLALEASIRNLGLLHPIVVTLLALGVIQLVSGSRRLGAWRRLFGDTRLIPCVVVPEERALQATFEENDLREELSPVDRARIGKNALDTARDPAAAATKLLTVLKYSEDHLNNLRRVFERPSLWQHAQAGKLTLRTAMDLCDSPEDQVSGFLAQELAANPKVTTPELTRRVLEHVGHEIRATIHRVGVKEVIGEVVTDFVADAKGVVTFDVEHDVKARRFSVLVRGPMPPGGAEAVRLKLSKAEAKVAARAAEIEAAARPVAPSAPTPPAPTPPAPTPEGSNA